MRILEYADLDTTGVRDQYEKTVRALEKGDFRSAKVKKLAPYDLYRAELDRSGRLLFKIMRHGPERVLLMLEVIRNHDYAGSRFIRGADISEGKIPFLEETPQTEGLEEIPAPPPGPGKFRLLDKVLCFDSEQDETFLAPKPLVVIGSAGSGKSAIALERMKHEKGEVLYVTLSPYLAEHARNLYFSHGFEREEQRVEFLSLREFLESLSVPDGQEFTYREFKFWFARQSGKGKEADSNRVYEEFRGVIAGSSLIEPYLSRKDYRELGIRQSIFLESERERIYDLFERYLAHLRESRRYDFNLAAFSALPKANPFYDMVVVDEVQDITPVQLALILKTLKKPGEFILCGDANQVVHPNFFSWARIKTLFFHYPDWADKKTIHVLRGNYRNSVKILETANRLLRIKHQRFGSLDRESHYIVTPRKDREGGVELLPAEDNVLRDLNGRTKRSVRYAVLVLRDEDKSLASRHFDTPLIFSVHEAKGLEYENVVLFQFVSGQREAFGSLCDGIEKDRLDGEFLYGRGKDKSDKALESLKFYVNALYVALTRATNRVLVVEKDGVHPLFGLLDLSISGRKGVVMAEESSTADWQREAARLELQGKIDQAEAIRSKVLKQKIVPWEILDRNTLPNRLAQALDPKSVSSKIRRRVYEFAVVHRLTRLEKAIQLAHPVDNLGKHVRADAQNTSNIALVLPGKKLRDLETQIDQYGVDYRNFYNQTPLMLAMVAGNAEAVRLLVERGTNIHLSDGLGRIPLHYGLLRAYLDRKYAETFLPQIYDQVAPPSIDVNAGGRLVKIDRKQGEYLILNAFMMVFPTLWNLGSREPGSRFHTLSSIDLTAVFNNLPSSIVPPYRLKREYVNALLAKTEKNGNDPYNRRLWERVFRGRYILDPDMSIRVGESWIPLREWFSVDIFGIIPLPDQGGR